MGRRIIPDIAVIVHISISYKTQSLNNMPRTSVNREGSEEGQRRCKDDHRL